MLYIFGNEDNLTILKESVTVEPMQIVENISFQPPQEQTSQEVPKPQSEQTSQEVPKSQPEQTPQAVPKPQSEQTSQEVPKSQPEQTPQEVPKPQPEQTPQEVPKPPEVLNNMITLYTNIYAIINNNNNQLFGDVYIKYKLLQGEIIKIQCMLSYNTFITKWPSLYMVYVKHKYVNIYLGSSYLQTYFILNKINNILNQYISQIYQYNDEYVQLISPATGIHFKFKINNIEDFLYNIHINLFFNIILLQRNIFNTGLYINADNHNIFLGYLYKYIVFNFNIYNSNLNIIYNNEFIGRLYISIEYLKNLTPKLYKILKICFITISYEQNLKLGFLMKIPVKKLNINNIPINYTIIIHISFDLKGNLYLQISLCVYNKYKIPISQIYNQIKSINEQKFPE